MNKTLTLYTGPNCHLCDQAKDVLYPVLQEMGWRLEEINIADSDLLKQQYGLRIPVVATENGDEKGWPFSAGQVKRLMVSE